uniref:UDP-N-acetylmuramoylalanine--D-glutamate ligase n=1 Tax=Lygus hesperus TaxID=30085 RepID=A0A0A9XSQ5_LYGHE
MDESTGDGSADTEQYLAWKSGMRSEIKVVNATNVFEDMAPTPVLPIQPRPAPHDGSELRIPRGMRYYEDARPPIVSAEEYISSSQNERVVYQDSDDSGLRYLLNVQEEARQLPFSVRAVCVETKATEYISWETVVQVVQQIHMRCRNDWKASRQLLSTDSTVQQYLTVAPLLLDPMDGRTDM